MEPTTMVMMAALASALMDQQKKQQEQKDQSAKKLQDMAGNMAQSRQLQQNTTAPMGGSLGGHYMDGYRDPRMQGLYRLMGPRRF